MKRTLIFTLILSMLLLSACALPAAAPKPTATPTAAAAPTLALPTPTQPVIGGISSSTLLLVHDQGSGTECSADATYTVTLNVTASGPTTAQYVIDATDGSGQVANGVFDSFDKPEVTDSLTFTGAETKSIQLKLKGTYSYPDSVTIRGKVNGKNLDAVSILCKPVSTNTATPTQAPAAACDAAQFIADVTIPDNTALKPGEIFTKTWRLKNVGTCSWDAGYTVNVDSGPGMTQNTAYLLSKVSSKSPVGPGDTVDISLDMQASSTPGTYQTFWRLQNGTGNVVPVDGGASGKLFFVQIVVSGEASGGKVTNVALQMVQEQGSGAVCAAGTTYFVYVDITTDGATTANYRVDATDDSGQVADGVFEDNGTPEVKGALTFSAAGTQRVALHLLGPYSYPDKITIRVKVNDAPSQSILVTCQ